MEQTLRQLGELLLAAIPTSVLLGLLFLVYRAVLGKPLERTLEERYSRTEGAQAQARADIAAADARTAEYEERLRQARAAVFQGLEQRRQKALEARTAAALAARSVAGERIRQARHEIEDQAAQARAGLEQHSERLAGEIIRTLLPAAAGTAGGRA